MDYLYIVLLRVLHVGLGLFWAGTGIYLAGFVVPAINAAGPEGGKFTQVLVKTNHVPLVMDIVSATTIVSGALLYFRVSSGFELEWITSRHGMALTVGGLSALAGYLVGFMVNRPTVARINRIGAEIAKAGGPPSPHQLEQMAALNARLTRAFNAIALSMAIAVSAMGVARYL